MIIPRADQFFIFKQVFDENGAEEYTTERNFDILMNQEEKKIEMLQINCNRRLRNVTAVYEKCKTGYEF